MVDQTKMRLLAERLIEQDGRTVTLVRDDRVNPADPNKPWRNNLETAKVVVDILGLFTEFEKEDVDGSLVRRGDKRVLVAAKSVEDEATGNVNIKIEDYSYILDGTTRWKIINAELIEPGPVRIMYDVHVRQ